MANSFLKAEQIAAQALGLLRREMVLPRLITARPISDFVGAKNDTVSIRVPAVLTARDYEWRTRTAPITVDDITETSVPVVLDTHLYHAGALTDEQMLLDIGNFGAQVLEPQTRAVAERMEDKIAAGMAAAPITEQITYTLSTGKPRDLAVDARKLLNDANVPKGDRVLLVGSAIESQFLKDDHLTQVDTSGTSDALREAIIGRLAGFTVATSNAIGENEAYAFHRTAFAFVTAAPAVPDGVSMGERRTYEGVSMRWIKDYDTAYVRDRSVVSTFFGFSSIDDGPDTPDGQDPEGAGNTDPENVRAVKITAS